MSARETASAKLGFTLIELLVVIAIIALLAGIMFPVFGAARSTARKATCQANLKQLYAAFELYAQDWNGVLPGPGGLYGNNSYWAQEGSGIEKYLRCQQLGSKSSYCCPAYTGEWKETRWSPRTYSMNTFLRDPSDMDNNTILRGLCMVSLMAPSNTILLYEGIPASDENLKYGEGYTYRCGDWETVRGYFPKETKYWQGAHKPWHRDRNNYLMCDGHIMTMAPEKWPAFKGPTCEANNFWYVSKFRDGE